MGTLHLPLPLLHPIKPPKLPLLNPYTFTRPFIAGDPCRTWKSSWPASAGRFDFEDDLGYDDFELGGPARQRTWWSDDERDVDDDGVVFWIFKVLRAFGWMVPAIAMSLLVGTGPNAFFMALAVPLGQTALSLVFDKVWGSTNTGAKYKSRKRTRKKPFVRSSGSTRTSENRNEEENKKGEVRGSYQSWTATAEGSYKKGDKSVHNFGGWDELDRSSDKVPKGKWSPKTNGMPKKQSNGKLSRMGRVKETPLLLRLLIAVFPFVGSWTRFLF